MQAIKAKDKELRLKGLSKEELIELAYSYKIIVDKSIRKSWLRWDIAVAAITGYAN